MIFLDWEQVQCAVHELIQRWGVLEDTPVGLAGDPGDGTSIDLDEPFLLRCNHKSCWCDQRVQGGMWWRRVDGPAEQGAGLSPFLPHLQSHGGHLGSYQRQPGRSLHWLWRSEYEIGRSTKKQISSPQTSNQLHRSGSTSPLSVLRRRFFHQLIQTIPIAITPNCFKMIQGFRSRLVCDSLPHHNVPTQRNLWRSRLGNL